MQLQRDALEVLQFNRGNDNSPMIGRGECFQNARFNAYRVGVRVQQNDRLRVVDLPVRHHLVDVGARDAPGRRTASRRELLPFGINDDG